MKKKTQRLQIIVEIASRNERNAAIELGKFQIRLDEEIARLNQLNQYFSEYKKGFITMGKASGISGSKMQSDIQFMEQLQTAIAEQEKVISSIESDLLQKRATWVQARNVMKSYKKVHQKSELIDRNLEQKREQKESDEQYGKNK